MHQHFNIQQLHALPTLYFCALFSILEQTATFALYHLIGFYNLDEKPL